MAKLKIIESCESSALMRKLIALKNYDLDIEYKRKKWGWMAGLSFLFAIAFFIVFGIIMDNYSGYDDFVIVPLMFVLSFVVSLVIYISKAVKDLDNRKLDSAMLLVEKIAEDVPPGVMCQLLVDFAEYKQGGKLISKEGGLFGPKKFEYSHSWLKFSGKLYDGNRFDLEIEQEAKRKEKPKRKYTKVNERIVEKATLTLKLNQKIYPNPQAVAEKVPSGSTPGGCTITKSLGTDRSLKVCMESPIASIVTGRAGASGSKDVLLNGEKILDVFVQTYRGILNSRDLIAAEPPPANV